MTKIANLLQTKHMYQVNVMTTKSRTNRPALLHPFLNAEIVGTKKRAIMNNT